MIHRPGREVPSERGVIILRARTAAEDTRTWAALRVLASMIARARQGVDSLGDSSVHGAGDST
jgi:hypothetical protein